MAPRPCKYNCGQTIEWDNDARAYKETDGTTHDFTRCQTLRQNPEANKQQSSTNTNAALFLQIGEMQKKLDTLIKAVTLLTGQQTLTASSSTSKEQRSISNEE